MRRRCAIYTRKSTEEGLDQAFNSLDAQREACAAFILSQANEGWEPVKEEYDDGGWSGGHMDRPALRQLLADVTAGKVDVIVVYKVDRLTRSLADFARIVEALDRAGASFVSVTQAFNTTTSMGRLTLNVLLSFAQFEREVTSERIRDKIAASKRKGMWMGGPVPLGYRLENRKLVIEEAEGETIRHIFRRYLELRSINALADELAIAGVRSKVRPLKDGRVAGGVAFTPGSLAQLLKNPLFMGKVRHRKEVFDGEHKGIIDPAQWDEVQRSIETNRVERKLGFRTETPSLLTGMIADPDGRPMTPMATNKSGRKHRYYATRTKPGERRGTIWRVQAGEVDELVIRYVGQTLRRERPSGDDREVELFGQSIPRKREVLIELGTKVDLGGDSLVVRLGSVESRTIEVPARIVRKGPALKLVLPFDQRASAPPNATLLKLVAQAQAAQRGIIGGDPEPLTSAYTDRYVYKLLRLSWLAPDIIEAIVDGRQPPELVGRRLLRVGQVPLNWAEQRRMFGFN